MLGFLLFLASWAHWSSYDAHGFRRKLDILLATAYMTLECITYQWDVVGLAIRMWSGACFLRACDYGVGSSTGLVFHLMFRHLAWVAVMRSYAATHRIALATIAYVALPLRGLVENPV